MKKSQKIRAWVDPPPLSFGQCPKENVFFLLMSSLRWLWSQGAAWPRWRNQCQRLWTCQFRGSCWRKIGPGGLLTIPVPSRNSMTVSFLPACCKNVKQVLWWDSDDDHGIKRHWWKVSLKTLRLWVLQIVRRGGKILGSTVISTPPYQGHVFGKRGILNT